jgi:hypothetical protein
MPYQIMYSSQAAAPMTLEGLEEILADARAGNEKRNVTGALVYVDGVFFQLLEGDKDVVYGLMENIAADTRHHSVKVFYEAQVDARAFESWRMAYLATTAEQMAKWAGLPGAATVEELVRDIERGSQQVPRILVNVLNALSRD